MASTLLQNSLLLATLIVLMAFGATCASGPGEAEAELNRGSLTRVVRSPQPQPQQQQPQPNFPSFPTPQFPFVNPEIVSQDTQRDKNGFAQTTIYKYPNGMGSSSVSTSYSGSSKVIGASWSLAAIIAVVSLKLFY